MAKKQWHRRQRGPNRTATRRPRSQPDSSPSAGSAPQDPFLGTLREALRSSEPTAFWVAAAPIVTVLENPGDLPDKLPEGVDMLQSFIEVDVAETTALLHMVAAMSRDDLFRARARRALESRHQPIPAHVTGLKEATITGARAFGDFHGDTHLIELTLPGQVRATLGAYVTRVPHLYFKDAFVMGHRLEQMQENFARLMAARGASLDEALQTLDPAQTRTALEQGLAGIRPGIAKEPEEVDQWPMLRPFVEFVLSLMPEGGPGYDEHGMLIGQQPGPLLSSSGPRGIDMDQDDDLDEDADREEYADLDGDYLDALLWDDDESGWEEDVPWIDEDGTDLAEEFLSSLQGEPAPLTDALVRYLMTLPVAREDDPLYWDPEVVRWVLVDVLPLDPFISAKAVEEVPAVLPQLVAWSHRVTGVDPGMTEAVQQAMTPLLAELPNRRADPRVQVRRSEVEVSMALSSGVPDALREAVLAQRVGGHEALDGLDTEPLPPEQIDLDAVPDDLVERVQGIDAALVAGLERVGRGQLEMGEPVLGEEFLTACRRLLAQVAARDADVLRRRAATGTTAASIAWIVGRGNELVGSPAPVRTQDLLRAFDVRSTPSQRSDSLMRAAVLPESPVGVSLGSPDLLVASAREAIIEKRDELEEDE